VVNGKNPTVTVNAMYPESSAICNSRFVDALIIAQYSVNLIDKRPVMF